MIPNERGYRLMYLWCARCGSERPHNRMKRRPSVAITRTRKSANGPLGYMRTLVDANQIPPGTVQVRAECMICGHGAHFVTTLDRLMASLRDKNSLCMCGLPWPHEGLHLEELVDQQAG